MLFRARLALRFPSGAPRSSRARGPIALVAAALVGILAVGVAAASTPVTNGYRDQTYGGGIARPTGDKPQSKVWFTDGTWWAGMFLYSTTTPLKSEYHIYRLDRATHSWADTGTVVDWRDDTHADYLWAEGSKTLWVASAYTPTAGATDDGIKVFKYTYNTTSNAYTPATGFPKTIPGTATNPATPSILGGAYSVTIDRDSTGRLWAAWAMNHKVLFSTSTDGGTTWSAPAQVPTQGSNTVKMGSIDADVASVVAFGTKVGIGWSDHDALPAASSDGYYFSVIAAGADPATGGNWSLEKLPTLVSGGSPTETADNHISVKATSDGRVFMVGKTGKDTAGCATNKTQPVIELFRRTTGGTWSAHLVGSGGDCNTRAQVVLSDELQTVYVVTTSPNGGGAVYLKSAPMGGPDALVFRGAADTTTQRGMPFIRSTTETLIDDPSTSKAPVTAASDIVVIANNLTSVGTTNKKYYLHAEMGIDASDTAAPTGTLSLANGAAFAKTLAVTATVAATDPGSGVSLVRLWNGGQTSAQGTTFAATGTLGWSMTAGADGPRTVWAQWRDAAGNWSNPLSDTITLDTTAPTGTVQVAGGASTTTSRNVTLNLTTSDGTGSGTTSVLISNSTDFTGVAPRAYASSIPWTLTSGDGAKTVYVKFVDALGFTSGAVSDAITLDSTPPAAGLVKIANGAVAIATTATTVQLSGAPGDATAARLSNVSAMTGAQTVAATGSFAWNLAAGGDGIRTVYAQWRDAAGNWSAVASDTIFLDTVPPKGTVLINAGRTWTAKTAVSLTFPNTDTDAVAVRVGTSPTLTGASFVTFTPGMTMPFTLPAGNGTKTVYAQFRDIGGAVSTIVNDAIGLDATAPATPTAPTHRLSGPVSTKITLRLTWSGGTDTGGSGFSVYVLRRQMDNGPWTTIAYPTTASALVGIDAYHNYRFQVGAIDKANNYSPAATGPVVRAGSYPEASTAITYRGTWKWSKATSYWGGKAKFATARGASATLTFTGRQVAWLARKGPGHGKANVYVDGVRVTTVNLYSTTAAYKQIVFTRKFATVGKHRVKIVVVGTAGHPRVTLDQFFVLR